MRWIVASLAVATAFGTPSSVPPCGLYVYRADIVRVIDGDTVVAEPMACPRR